MLKLPAAVYEAANQEDAQARLGDILGLDGPAAPEVTHRALKDSDFAARLMGTRKFPEWRNRLLDDPANRLFLPAAEPAPAPDGAAREVVLFTRAAAALVQWGAAGFTRADPARISRRLDACHTCPQLTNPPDRMSYNGAGLVIGRDQKSCAACGCFVKAKAVMATESCPERDPEDAALTRWGEAPAA